MIYSDHQGFRGTRAAASLKPGLACPRNQSASKFPRHARRGLIEAWAAPNVPERLGTFPRHARRGLIEATCGRAPRHVGYRFPRHARRGLIEARRRDRPFRASPSGFRGTRAAASLKRLNTNSGIYHLHGFPRHARRGLIEASATSAPISRGRDVSAARAPRPHRSSSRASTPRLSWARFPRHARRGLIEACGRRLTWVRSRHGFRGTRAAASLKLARGDRGRRCSEQVSAAHAPRPH